MSETKGTLERPVRKMASGIRVQDQWWILIALAVLVVAILSQERWYLNFVHVFAGILWTGTDIFMGFVLGPILRRLDLASRRAVIANLMPRMIFFMPTVATITTTAGWYLADQLGYFGLPFPARWWVIAAIALTVIMAVQGFGILLPTNLRVYFEIRKEQPDGEKIRRWMQIYVRVVALQGLMQLALIAIMARFVTGF